MIPFQAALAAYIPVAALLMMDRNAARGFSLAFLGALLFLPAGARFDLPGVPDLEKDNAWVVGVLLGTLLFHPGALARFRWHPADVLMICVLPCILLTSVVNGFGPYDGASRGVEYVLNFMLIVFLARLHLGSAAGIRTFMLCLVGGAVIYVPLAAYEFRMSPQIHTTTYGYFQHVFIQHMRGSYFRPIVYMSHALALGRFFAFTAFLALYPLRGDLERRFGAIGRHLYLAPLAGLILSMSYGPWMLFVLLCAGWHILPRARWVGAVPPAAALIWLALVFADFRPGFFVVDAIGGFNPDRAQSLGYRLLALQEYRDIILNRFWLGHGGWGHGRIAGRATDAQALIALLERGFIGYAFSLGWWIAATACAYRLLRKARGTVFEGRVLAVAALASIGLSVVVIDVGLEPMLAALLAGMMAIDARAPDPGQVPARRAPHAGPVLDAIPRGPAEAAP